MKHAPADFLNIDSANSVFYGGCFLLPLKRFNPSIELLVVLLV